MIFKNSSGNKGDTGHILFLTSGRTDAITRQTVEDNIDIQYYFDHKYCDKIVVDVVNPNNHHTFQDITAGGCFEEIFWWGGGFSGRGIMYIMSRLRPILRDKFLFEEEK